ncbi:MAG: hypothetical protein M1818_008495 [Claussenomyces sp. TS43310]|nr:MAG: hypothetical protein M1818_008495 [Claussenomyces sp. TS43310]
MLIERDTEAPQQLPNSLKQQILDDNEEIQKLYRTRASLQHQLRISRSAETRVRIRGEIRPLTRKIYQKRVTVARQAFRKYHDDWFRDRAASVIAYQKEAVLTAEPEKSSPASQKRPLSALRQAVAESLYPESGRKIAILETLEALLRLCCHQRLSVKERRSRDSSRQPLKLEEAELWSDSALSSLSYSADEEPIQISPSDLDLDTSQPYTSILQAPSDSLQKIQVVEDGSDVRPWLNQGGSGESLVDAFSTFVDEDMICDEESVIIWADGVGDRIPRSQLASASYGIEVSA